MSVVTMSAGMEAHLRQLLARALTEAGTSFNRSLTRTMDYPMPTLSSIVTFKITTPADGVRVFTAAISLTELVDKNTAPTTGFNRRGG